MIFAYLVLSSSSIATRADPSFHFFLFQIPPLFGNIIYVFIFKKIIDPSGKPAMRSNRFLCWWVAAAMAWTIGRKRRRFARVAAAAVATAAIVKRIDARVASIVASNRDLTAGTTVSSANYFFFFLIFIFIFIFIISLSLTYQDLFSNNLHNWLLSLF